MANLKPALDLTLKHEGGFVNDATDRGGETIFGISRKNNPLWNGWKYLDGFRAAGMSTANIESKMRSTHFDLVENLYRDNYWKPLKLDEVKSQAVANQLFDMSVNHGVTRAAKFAQELAGAVPDGNVGPKTVVAINATQGLGNKLVKRRIDFFFSICDNDQSQVRFLKGWVRRATEFVEV